MPRGFEGASPLEQVALVTGWLKRFFKVEHHPSFFFFLSFNLPASNDFAALFFVCLSASLCHSGKSCYSHKRYVFIMREEDGLETAESFNQTQCSKNNEGACTVSRRMLACKYKCVYTCILSFSNVFLKITFPLHMGCCVRSACDLMCCSVVTSGDQSSRV